MAAVIWGRSQQFRKEILLPQSSSCPAMEVGAHSPAVLHCFLPAILRCFVGFRGRAG